MLAARDQFTQLKLSLHEPIGFFLTRFCDLFVAAFPTESRPSKGAPAPMDTEQALLKVHASQEGRPTAAPQLALSIQREMQRRLSLRGHVCPVDMMFASCPWDLFTQVCDDEHKLMTNMLGTEHPRPRTYASAVGHGPSEPTPMELDATESNALMAVQAELAALKASLRELRERPAPRSTPGRSGRSCPQRVRPTEKTPVRYRPNGYVGVPEEDLTTDEVSVLVRTNGCFACGQTFADHRARSCPELAKPDGQVVRSPRGHPNQ